MHSTEIDAALLTGRMRVSMPGMERAFEISLCQQSCLKLPFTCSHLMSDLGRIRKLAALTPRLQPADKPSLGVAVSLNRLRRSAFPAPPQGNSALPIRPRIVRVRPARYADPGVFSNRLGAGSITASRAASAALRRAAGLRK